MKKIYILLTKSPTILSKMITSFTGAKYTHASLSFDKEFTQMYSFGRKYSRCILPAHMKHEKLDSGFFKTFNKIPCVLLEADVEDEEYERALHITKDFYNHKNKYTFNILGLIYCGMKIERHRNNKYFCSQFVSEVLRDAKIINISKDPCLIRPMDFLDMEEFTIIYSGKLNDLKTQCA